MTKVPEHRDVRTTPLRAGAPSQEIDPEKISVSARRRAASRLIVALDTPDPSRIEHLCQELKGLVGYFKIGLEPYCALGPRAIEIARKHGDVFLDLKLHDIPRTVEAAAREAARHGVGIVNVHALGGREMMRAALEGARSALGGDRPIMLAVTVLTSLSSENFTTLSTPVDPERFFSGKVPMYPQMSKYGPVRAIGSHICVGELALRLALDAKDAGLDGVVAAVDEVEAIKKACGPDFLVVAPGIRPQGSDVGDQKRVATPGVAIELGADFLVVGRPIVQSPNPHAAAEKIVDEIARAIKDREREPPRTGRGSR